MSKYTNQELYQVNTKEYYKTLSRRIGNLDLSKNNCVGRDVMICRLQTDIELLEASYEEYIEIYRIDNPNTNKEYIEDICAEIQKRVARKELKIIEIENLIEGE